MKDNTIQIYGRIRPLRKNKKALGKYTIEKSIGEKQTVSFHVPKDIQTGFINNQRERFTFQFDHVFDATTEQEEVFDVVAKPVIQSCMHGYNGTIFAYGQTGSGKTFTITGGAERYADRGLIPRTLQYIFKTIQMDTSVQYSVQISYLELYNEVGYDLLDSTRDAKKLEDLPKVTIQEDENEQIHLRNLSLKQVSSEEEALNLLFVGDTNRMIAETPSNPSSSRSHCIFIICISSRRNGEEVIRRSKLHLVDLAGSERVSRTGIDGTLLREAKYINLSLHYLEQVIIALHESSTGKRTHIPYRNSMMTTVLRDSLGGNCKTTMIATIAVEDDLIDESISTCRFSQRVALISNKLSLNEEMDPHLVIVRLKREIERLKAEIAVMRGNDDGQVPEYELNRIRQLMQDYIADTSPEAQLVLSSYPKIQAAFSIFKSMVTGKEIVKQAEGGSEATKSIEIDQQGLTPTQMSQFQKLKNLVIHRDNEINILVSMIAQLKKQMQEKPQLQPSKSVPVLSLKEASQARMQSEKKPLELSQEKARAFEIFKRGYPSGDWIDNQKGILKDKYAQAKALGESANRLRIQIKDLKESLSQEPTESLKQQLVETVKEYKESYQKLKDFKMEIEHLQHLLEQARLRLTRDFEHWYVNVYESTEISDPKSMDMADLKTSDMTVPEMAHHTVKTIDTLKSRSRPSSRLGPRSTDDDIEAFYKARDEILKLKSRRNGQDTKSVIE